MPKDAAIEETPISVQKTVEDPGNRRKTSTNPNEEKLKKILKANAKINLKIHEQEQRIMEELAIGLTVIDRDVDKLRRKRGGALFDGHLLLSFFSIFLVLMAVLAIYQTLNPAKSEPFRQTKILLRFADPLEDVEHDSYPVCSDAYTSPWRRVTDKAAIRKIFDTENGSVYAYTRIVIVERDTNQWFPEAEDCPPSLLLLSKPLPSK